MGLSWHEDDYRNMVEEMEDYVRTVLRGNGLASLFKEVPEAEVHGIVGHLVNIMIDHGAVDPT